MVVYPPIAKRFCYFWRWIFKEKTEEIWYWLFFTTWISWILNFIIEFNNAFTRTLAILAALGSNLVANLGLRKYSPSFICTSAACNSRLSWWAVLGWRLKMYGSSWWISFLDNKRCDWFKTLKCENFEAWEFWQAYKHSTRPFIFWQGEHCSCNWFRIQTFTGKA